jgi:outer membrane protein
MTLPFYSVPTHFKRRYLQGVMNAGIWSALALTIPASSLAQIINPAQDRNASTAGQVTVLPDASIKTPSTPPQNLSLPPALAASASSSVPAFSNFSQQPGDPAAPTQNMDLVRLYQEAAFNDPVLNSARFNYAANKEFYWQGLSTLLPQVSANPAATRFFQHGEGNSRVYDQRSYTVTLTQPIFNAAALEVFRQGDLVTKVSDLQFLQAQQDLVIRVSQAYFDVLTAQDNVELFQNKKGLIKQQLQAAQSKFEVGSATIVDTNDAQARFDLANAQEIAAQAELVVRRGVLEQIIGRPVASLKPLAKDATIAGVVIDPRVQSKASKDIVSATANANGINPNLPPGQTLDDWIKQAEAANYGVLASQLNVNIAQSTYRSALAANVPTVNFVGTTGFNAANGSQTNFNPSTTQNIFNNTVGLQMNIPIFSGGFNNSVIRQNAALLDKAKSDYDGLRRAAAQNTRQAFTGFYGGLATVKAFEAAEKSGATALASSQLGFDVGNLINLDVLIALDALFTTRATLYKARYDTILNALKLKAQAASLTDQDLLAVNALLK